MTTSDALFHGAWTVEPETGGSRQIHGDIEMGQIGAVDSTSSLKDSSTVDDLPLLPDEVAAPVIRSLATIHHIRGFMGLDLLKLAGHAGLCSSQAF
jgi:hypothetical protein